MYLTCVLLWCSGTNFPDRACSHYCCISFLSVFVVALRGNSLINDPSYEYVVFWVLELIWPKEKKNGICLHPSMKLQSCFFITLLSCIVQSITDIQQGSVLVMKRPPWWLLSRTLSHSSSEIPSHSLEQTGKLRECLQHSSSRWLLVQAKIKGRGYIK